jgi:hypothetical protein
VNLEDIIGLEEAAEIAGRQPVSMRRAAALGKLDARRIGTPGRAYWITTREAVSEYLAYVASASWAQQPQRMTRPGGHQRKRRRRRARAR